MAAIKKKATRKPQSNALDPTPRHLWLASLGALVAARRESKAAVLRAAGKVEAAVADARKAVRRAETELRSGIDGVRDQVAPKVACISNEVEARLAPIVAKLGLKRKPARKTRKPAAKKATARRTSRKPVKRVAKKAAR
ncbi:MAG: hypothetical protein QM612_00275 [Thermomonas sp.]|uniref:hypothetical protein n=1 Tax=Thermomonas sp. TaxID=1971895 RepID=UPI0039E52F06